MILDDSFSGIKEENKRKISIELPEILKKKPKLNSKEFISLFRDIWRYYMFYPETKNDKENYFDKLLEIYDHTLTDELRFKILLKINSKESFKKFAKKHYDSLKKKFAATVFISTEDKGEITELNDFKCEVKQIYKNKSYELEWFDYDLELIMELYELFGSDIKVFQYGKIEKYDLNQLNSLSKEMLEKLFFLETSKELNLSNIKVFLRAFSECYREGDNFFNSFNITDKEILSGILCGIEEQYQDSSLSFLETFSNKLKLMRLFYSKVYNDVLRNNVENMNLDDDTEINGVFSLGYLGALNKLASYNKEELSNNPLYLRCFKIFLEETLVNYNDPVTRECIDIFEVLFKRVINRKDIINIMCIDNFKTLYHYYKSDEYISSLDIPLEMIKRNNVRQYNNLKQKHQKYLDELSLYDRDFCDNNTGIIINLLDVFGYDLANKLIEEFPTDIKIILEYTKQKSDNYMNLLKNLLSLKIKELLINNTYNIGVFLRCFDVLYEQGLTNVSLSRIAKSMKSLSYALFPSNFHIEENLEKLNLVGKGDPLLEKIEGIKLYDKYRFRVNSSIPDVFGSYNNCDYSMVDLHSPEIISNGIGNYLLPNNIVASSCLTPNGKAASCLRHGAINPNGRFFKIVHQNKIVAYSWVWRAGDVICFDNIEVTDELLKINNYAELLFDIYQKVANDLIFSTTKEENRGVRLVVLGRNKIDFPNKYFDSLEGITQKDQELYKPNSNEELYLKDSSEKQLVLAGDYKSEIKTEDVAPIYMYQRPLIVNFSDLDKSELSKRLNAIYFDYCLKNNKKYHALNANYINGFLTEDWFIGMREDGNNEFFYRGADERLFLEAKEYLPSIDEKGSENFNIIHPEKEVISYLLERNNFEIDYGVLQKMLDIRQKDYFELSKEYFTHYPSSLKNFTSILENNAITSAEYGNHFGGRGCNGSHFISVARVNTNAYECYLKSPTFVITSDICAFSYSLLTPAIAEEFTYSSYPLREPRYSGEYHVLDAITLDKSEAIFVTTKDLCELTQIIYIQELFGNKLPLIEIADNSYIDKGLIKRYCKIKK